ncbi:collagen alpha-1(I) chain-like [Manis pentadactyla]|uniref:collagen alpha-1(I) chain-like n=1 Tax=Manis pentadactyla TaxID=143292 RepID=UPI00255D13F2|nr:collagen alpha-1(I) chain-like [Manis pentadactyla]
MQLSRGAEREKGSRARGGGKRPGREARVRAGWTGARRRRGGSTEARRPAVGARARGDLPAPPSDPGRGPREPRAVPGASVRPGDRGPAARCALRARAGALPGLCGPAAGAPGCGRRPDASGAEPGTRRARPGAHASSGAAAGPAESRAGPGALATLSGAAAAPPPTPGGSSPTRKNAHHVFQRETKPKRAPVLHPAAPRSALGSSAPGSPARRRRHTHTSRNPTRRPRAARGPRSSHRLRPLRRPPAVQSRRARPSARAPGPGRPLRTPHPDRGPGRTGRGGADSRGAPSQPDPDRRRRRRQQRGGRSPQKTGRRPRGRAGAPLRPPQPRGALRAALGRRVLRGPHSPRPGRARVSGVRPGRGGRRPGNCCSRCRGGGGGTNHRRLRRLRRVPRQRRAPSPARPRRLSIFSAGGRAGSLPTAAPFPPRPRRPPRSGLRLTPSCRRAPGREQGGAARPPPQPRALRAHWTRVRAALRLRRGVSSPARRVPPRPPRFPGLGAAHPAPDTGPRPAFAPPGGARPGDKSPGAEFAGPVTPVPEGPRDQPSGETPRLSCRDPRRPRWRPEKH